MKLTRDVFGQQRKHQLILCNPNGKELAVVGMAKEIKIHKSLKEISTLTFVVAKLGDEITPYYDLLENKRLIKVNDYGNFIISKVSTVKDGILEEKEIECVSIEYEFSSKIISFDGSYKLYSASDYDNTLVGLLLSYMPNWKIKYVDSEVANKTRHFDIVEQNIYNIIKETVEKAYDCIFEFDIETREISIYKVANRIKKTNIFLSDRNLVKELNIESDSQNIITALSVYGSGDLSIANVNPLGNSIIYDFSYYMNNGWMEQDLIDALTAWQNKVDSSYITYGNLLTNYKNTTQDLLELESELYDLNSELSSLNQAHGLAVTANDSEETSRLSSDIKNKEIEISNKKTEISNKRTEMDSINAQRMNIVTSLSFENNFTKEQIDAINIFIEQSKVQNEAYYQGENDTVEDIQNLSMELLEWGRESLHKQCQPKYSFTIDLIDFTNIISKCLNYDQFIQELDLGASITICIDKEKDYYATAILIGYTKGLNDYSSMELEFCSRLDNGTLEYTWEELINQASTISTQFAFDEYKYKQGEIANNTINNYINNALDLTKQMIMTSDNQEFTISDVGIRGKEWLEDEQRYSNEEIWMQKNVIAFSNDNFNTVKQAIGKITLLDGSESYGVVADSIVGRILIGGELFIQNENNTFRVDSDGIYIKDANILMTNTDGTEQSIPDLVETATEKFDRVLTSNGLLNTEKMEGQILAGTNNIYVVNNSTTKAMLINESGLLIANSKLTNGDWDWRTAISADGVLADVIQANGTLSGVNIVGGSLNIGNNSFTVNNSGNVSITKGSINIGDNSFIVDNYGNVSISRGSINIGNGNFTVDSGGNVIAKSITLTDNTTGEVDANNLVIKNLVVGENVLMGENATISWMNVASKPNDLAYMDDLSWYNISHIPSDLARIGDIPALPSYIQSTKITQTSIESPNIVGGTITGAVVQSWGTNGSGVTLNSNSMTVYANSSTQCGYIRYDNTGNGNTEGSNRMYIATTNGYNMKLQSASNMSLTASKIYLEGRVIINGVEIGASGSVAVFG